MNQAITPAGTSKTHIYYWHDRLFKRDAAGETIPQPAANGVSGDWWVQISVASKQSRIPLKTPNKEAAAALACKIYDSLRANGWEATRDKFPSIWPPKFQRIDSPTVGEFLAAIEAHALGFAKKTHIKPIVFKSYSRKFRRLVAAIAEIKCDVSRFHRGAGSVNWRKSVDSVNLAELTPAKINRWRNQFVSASKDAKKRMNASNTVHSILRNAKSLFSKKVFDRLADAKVELTMPATMPFDGVTIGGPEKSHYSSSIDAAKLARDAHKELAKQEPELFKIFLLAFGVGLRRGEIDRLTWPQFNWSKNQINVAVTEHGENKSDGSNAAVDVDPAVMKMFRKSKDKRTGEFVVESAVAPRPGANWHHYRCDCGFKRMNAWLRGKGVDVQKPTHTMRKEFGSRICEQFGIFAASEALRHADIRITRAHYVDKRGRIHLEVGKMLTGKN